MSTSLLRGLRALEMLAEEALGVSEVARRLGVDKAGVSRVLSQLHDEGWVLRTGARYVLGERALGLASNDTIALRNRAIRVTRALHEHTGLTAVIIRLAGEGAHPVAVAGPTDFFDPAAPYENLWSTAGGIALLAQLPDHDLDRRLATHPWPRPVSQTAPADAAAVRSLVRSVRAGVPVHERSWSIRDAACIAVPWPVVEPAPPHAVALVGALDRMDRNLASLRTALQAAATTTD